MASQKEYRKQWHDNHRGEIIARSAEWRKAHPNYMKEFDENHRHPCPDCGRLISRLGTRCRSCAGKLRWKINPSIKTKAERRIRDGYVYIYRPEHPRANIDGYAPEDILVWEETHGKALPQGWLVHHLNGIKHDNHPINLEGTTSKKHRLIIPLLQKRIQELEALLNSQSQLL